MPNWPPYQQWYQVMGFQKRGKLGNLWIHKHYVGFDVVAKIYYPYNPRTNFQQAWRSVFAGGIYNWKSFDPIVQNFYNTATSPKAYRGMDRYMTMYLRANYPPQENTWSSGTVAWADNNISWIGN